MEKMTNKTALEIAISVLSADNAHDEAVAKLQKMLESLEKKKSAPSKAQTAKATANMGLGELIVQHLRENPNQMFTITELMKSVEGLPAEITNQKLTAIFRLDSVKPYYTRTMEKGKAYFQYKSED